MKFRIHFTIGDDEEDSIIVEGYNIDEVKNKADIEVGKRNGADPWSDQLE